MTMKWLARIVSWFWLTIAVCCVLIALAVTLGRELSPRLSELAPTIEERLFQATGLQFDIDGLNATWHGLSPTLEFSSVNIAKEGFDNAISLQRGKAQFNLMRSVQTRTLVFDELSLGSFDIAIEEIEQGGWRLLGVPKGKGNTNITPIIDSLVETYYLRAGQGNLSMNPLDGRQLNLKLDNFRLLSDGFYRSVDIRLTAATDSEPIVVKGAGEGDPRDLDNFVSRVYLSAKNQSHQGGRVWALLGPILGLSPPEHFSKHTIEYSSNLWLTLDPENKFQWVANFAIDRLPLPSVMQDLAITDMDFAIAGRSTQMAQHSFSVPRLEMNLDGEPFSLQNSWFKLEPGTEGAVLRLAIDRLDLAQLSPLAKQIKNERAQEWLQALQLGGELLNIEAKIPLARSQLKELSIKANALGLKANAYKGSPGLSGVTGYIGVNGLGGTLQLSQANLSQFYPKLFKAPIVADSVSGSIDWLIDPDNNRFFIGTQKLDVVDDQFKARGSFILDAPINKHLATAHDPFLSLEIALEDVQAKAIKQFTPVNGSDALQKWLNQAFNGGSVTEGHVSIFGNAHAAQKDKRKLLLAGDVNDMQLSFDSRWPQVSGLQASLLLDGVNMSGTIKRGQFMGADLSGGKFITLAENFELTTPRWLRISGDTEATIDQGLSILRNTPLKATFARAVNGWQGQGELVASLQIDVPLSGQQVAPKVTLDSVITAPVFELLNQQLTFTDVAGRIVYDDGQVSSNLVKANLFGEPFTAEFNNYKNQRNSLEISFDGAASARQIERIIDRPWMKFVTGKAKVDGQFVAVPELDPYFTVTSDLHGASLDLPAPLNKETAQLMPMTLSYNTVTRDLAATSSALKVHLKGSPIGYGEAAFAIGEASLPSITRGQYRVSVNVAHLDALAWNDTLDRYLALYAAHEVTEAEAGIVWDIDGVTDDMILDGRSIGPLGFQARASSQSTWASLEHLQFSGIVELQSDQLPRVDLAFLDQAVFDQAAIPSDINDQVVTVADYSGVPAMAMKIDRFIKNGEDLGEFSFTLRNDGVALTLDDLNYKESVPSGLATTEPGMVRWQYAQQERTDVMLSLSMSDVGGVLERQGLPTLMDAANGALELDLSWPGGLDNFELAKLKGSTSIDINDGTFNSNASSRDVLGLFNLFNFSYWADRAKIEEAGKSESVGFSKTSGVLNFDDGMMTIEDQIAVVGHGASFELSGDFDLKQSTIDGNLVVTLPVGENVAWITALAAGLPAAAGVFLVSKLFEEQLAPLQSVTYKLGGSFDDPTMSFETLFKVDQKSKSN